MLQTSEPPELSSEFKPKPSSYLLNKQVIGTSDQDKMGLSVSEVTEVRGLG